MKKGHFLYICPKEIFLTLVSAQYIVYRINFQNKYTSTYHKTLLQTLFYLFLKSSKAFRLSLMSVLILKQHIYLQIQFVSIYCIVFTNTIWIHILCCIYKYNLHLYIVLYLQIQFVSIYCVVFYKYNLHPYIVLYLEIQFVSIYCVVFTNTFRIHILCCIYKYNSHPYIVLYLQIQFPTQRKIFY